MPRGRCRPGTCGARPWSRRSNWAISAGVRLRFKAEMFQKTGSFKPRGMLNSLYHLDEDAKQRGVITMSAGNAAQALAFASAQLGIAATVVMPQGGLAQQGRRHRELRRARPAARRHARPPAKSAAIAA